LRAPLPPEIAPRFYARLTFQKVDRLRYLSHLDLARCFDRAVRRAALPVAYTEGFNPHARIMFASALGVGVASLGELCAVSLAESVRPDEILRRLNAQLPVGLKVTEARVEPRTKRSPFSNIARAVYDIRVDVQPDEARASLAAAVAAMLAAPELQVTRQTKSRVSAVDIRPGIYALTATTIPEPGLAATLSLAEGNLVKPLEVVQTLEGFLSLAFGVQTHVRLTSLTRTALLECE
jgi:radical SAM-linked protein